MNKFVIQLSCMYSEKKEKIYFPNARKCNEKCLACFPMGLSVREWQTKKSQTHTKFETNQLYLMAALPKLGLYYVVLLALGHRGDGYGGELELYETFIDSMFVQSLKAK